ncbi:unnamed protein product [Prunus armeniaca]
MAVFDQLLEVHTSSVGCAVNPTTAWCRHCCVPTGGWRGRVAPAVGAYGCKAREVTGPCGACSAIPAVGGGCKPLRGYCKVLAATVPCGCSEVSTTKP